MSMSDSERLEIVHTALDTMLGQRPSLVGKDAELVRLLDGLWPALAPLQRGGISTGETLTARGAWAFGLLVRARQLREDETELDGAAERAWQDSAPGFRHVFNPKIQDLVGRPGSLEQAVVVVYEQAEEAMRALRYYPDELIRTYQELQDALSRVIGHCYHHFAGNEEYLQAHLAHQIWCKIWTGAEDDLLNELMKDQCLHHDIRSDTLTVGELNKLWEDIQLRDLSMQERLLILLRMLGSRFHHDHQFDGLKQRVARHNKAHRDDKVDVARLAKQFARCKKAASLQAEAAEHQQCDLTGNDSWWPKRRRKRG